MEASLIAYSRQKILFNSLDVIANNTANASTSGFKADLAIALKDPKEISGKPSPYPVMKNAVDISQGTLKGTGRQLDVAIQGSGFFQIDTPLGPRYTRSGNFFINSEGSFVDKAGNPVVGDGGTISLDPNDNQIKIGEDGTIVAVTENGDIERGKIGVFNFQDISKIEKAGNSYFKSNETPESSELGTFKISQSMLEDSNVNPIEQMTQMIDISRSVQTLAKIISDEHQRMKDAVSRLAAKA